MQQDWPANDICPVCCCSLYEDDKVVVFLDSCRHLLCSDCCCAWAKEKNVCPLCRKRFEKSYFTASGEIAGEFKRAETDLEAIPLHPFAIFGSVWHSPMYLKIDLRNVKRKLLKKRPEKKDRLAWKAEKNAINKQQRMMQNNKNNKR